MGPARTKCRSGRNHQRGLFVAFTGERVATQMNSLPFEILPALLSHGAAFYEGSETVNLIEEEKGPKYVRSLRVRDAWG